RHIDAETMFPAHPNTMLPQLYPRIKPINDKKARKKKLCHSPSLLYIIFTTYRKPFILIFKFLQLNHDVLILFKDADLSRFCDPLNREINQGSLAFYSFEIWIHR